MNEIATSETQNETRYNIRVLDRAIRVLFLLSDAKPRTLNEISEEILLSPSTTFRLLSTLNYYRFVKRDERSGHYRLGLACLTLARGFQDSNDLRTVALPELEVLRDITKETVHLAILDNMEVIYIEKLPGLHAIGLMSSRVGGRSPVHCTGLGKMFLANLKSDQVLSYVEQHGLPKFTDTTITDPQELIEHLKQIRSQGYAFDRGEHESDVRCVAAPIFNSEGQAIAALSVSGPAVRLEPLEDQTEIIFQTTLTAMNISRQMGYA
jgi:DNA-binding IclR family transcriptional regulator